MVLIHHLTESISVYGDEETKALATIMYELAI